VMPAPKKHKTETKPISSTSNNRASLSGSGRRRGNHRQAPPVARAGALYHHLPQRAACVYDVCQVYMADSVAT
jgi:hypothetical protein